MKDNKNRNPIIEDMPVSDDREATSDMTARHTINTKGDILTMATKETTLTIPALHCDSCVKTVTRILEALPGVEVTRTEPDTKLVDIGFDESAISLDQIREALDEDGFSPED